MPAPTTSRTPAAAERRRILVVDDNRDAAESLALLLKIENHEVQTAFTAAAALSIACDQAFDLVLLDLRLPDMDGYEVARRLRSQPHLSSACIIALTGYSQTEHRDRAEKAGFDGFLVKPVPMEALIELLKTVPSAGRDTTTG